MQKHAVVRGKLMKSGLHFIIIVPYAMTQSSCHLADNM